MNFIVKLLMTVTILSLVALKFISVQTTPQFGLDGFVKPQKVQGGFIANHHSRDWFNRFHDATLDINGNSALNLVAAVRFDGVAALNTMSAQTATQFVPDGFVKIQEGSGGFIANLDPGDRFSRDHDAAGDINGDGVLDLVVGARSDDDGATDAGAVYILFMNNDGTVLSNQKISMLEGGFTETLNAGNFFGYGVAGIGDYDADGIPDIAVSSPVPPNRSIYIIHLNRNGTVKNFVKNSNVTAQGLTAIGDLNGDGRIDLVACDPGSDLGGTDIGAVRILFFDAASQIQPAKTVIINPLSGGFGTGLVDGDQFGGREVAMLGDVDFDGTKELAVGAFMSDSGKGAIWILSLDPTTFNVTSKLKITEGLNGFSDTLTTGANPNGTAGANFGHSMCAVGDLNGDGIPDLMTGANQQNEGWGYILYLNSNKTVNTFTRINNSDGGFGLLLDPEERFSRSISCLGDLRGDGSIAVNYGGGAGGTGALYVLFFKPLSALSINDVWISEGNSGTKTATFTVSLSQASSSSVNFDISTADDTAIAGSDFVARSLSGQSIPAGQTSKTFSVSINGDDTVEPDETFAVNVGNVVGASMADGFAIGIILNDDGAMLSIADVSVLEGSAGAHTAMFTISLSQAAIGNVSFDIATTDLRSIGNSALANSDYVAANRSGIIIPAGQTDTSFTVKVLGDTHNEKDEIFGVNISNISGAELGNVSAVGLIVNDDAN